MKKLLIMLLALTLVFVAGCKKDEKAEDDAPSQQQEQPIAEQTEGKGDEAKPEENAEQSEEKAEEKSEEKSEEAVKEESKYTPETAKEVTSVDVNDMKAEDMDKLVNMFNSEDSTEDQKEAARIQLEALFKQAEAQQ